MSDDAPIPVTKVSAYIPVSQEMLDNRIDVQAAFNRSPKEWAQVAAARQARAAEELHAAVTRHEAALAGLTGPLGDVIEWHRPQQGSSVGPVCRGCDVDGYDAEPPAWPCSTWVIATRGA